MELIELKERYERMLKRAVDKCIKNREVNEIKALNNEYLLSSLRVVKECVKNKKNKKKFKKKKKKLLNKIMSRNNLIIDMDSNCFMYIDLDIFELRNSMEKFFNYYLNRKIENNDSEVLYRIYNDKKISLLECKKYYNANKEEEISF